jgi:serine/threonine-protein kinase HipA
MAQAAGIRMADTRLFHENGRAHFMTKRFDRMDPAADGSGGERSSGGGRSGNGGNSGMPRKIHMQSLCAMDHVDFNLIRTNQYDSFFAVIQRLGLPEEDMTEAFRRMAFNYFAMNCDDHSKNFAFLMDEQGKWSLAPAYDVTFAYDSKNIWLREHLMGVGGKFSGVGKKDLLKFAERHEVPYARKSLGEVMQAIAMWPEFAKEAGLPKASGDIIAAAIRNVTQLGDRF